MNDFLNVKLKLINVFLLEMTSNIVDISYSFDENHLDLQIVLLENTSLSPKYLERLNEVFSKTAVTINNIYINKELFNQKKGEWLPIGYKWLYHVLYSKAEIL